MFKNYPFYFSFFADIIFLIQRKMLINLKIRIMKSVSNSMFMTPKRQFNFLSLGSGYTLVKFFANLQLTLENFSSNQLLLKSHTLSSDTGCVCLFRGVKPSSPAEVSIKKSYGQKQQKNST